MNLSSLGNDILIQIMLYYPPNQVRKLSNKYPNMRKIFDSEDFWLQRLKIDFNINVARNFYNLKDLRHMYYSIYYDKLYDIISKYFIDSSMGLIADLYPPIRNNTPIFELLVQIYESYKNPNDAYNLYKNIYNEYKQHLNDRDNSDLFLGRGLFNRYDTGTWSHLPEISIYEWSCLPSLYNLELTHNILDKYEIYIKEQLEIIIQKK